MDRTTIRMPIARDRTTSPRGIRRRPGRPASSAPSTPDAIDALGARTRLRRRVRHVMAGVSIVALALVGAIAVPAGAQAATYPPWD